ncbi:MAG: T9SS type A sorting domain-containing protein [Bacteroidota bacterium]
MKVRILFFLMMLAATAIQAQYPAQKVLVEAGTGVWCASCPTAVQMIDMLIEDGADIAVVKYHSGEGHKEPFESISGLERIGYYDVTFYPSLFVDGVRVEPWNSYQEVAELYEDANADERDYRINLTGEWRGDDRIFLRAATERAEGAEISDARLFVAVTESSIPYEWHGETQVDFAHRFMWPNGEGLELDFGGEAQVHHDFEAEIAADWDHSNLAFVAFLQENESKKILQATRFTAQQVGIAEQSAESVKIYPNPATDFIYLEGKKPLSEIKLFTTHGHLIYSADKPITQIDVRHFSSGLYFLQAKYGNQSITKKIHIR